MPEADEMEEALRKATSIFDFEARTIDGELVKLSKYESVQFDCCPNMSQSSLAVVLIRVSPV